MKIQGNIAKAKIEDFAGSLPINIFPYHPDREKDILKIVSAFYQNSLIKVEMVRASYISRAKQFQSFGVFTAHSENGDLVGAVCAAEAPVRINEKVFRAGFGFDLCVTPSWTGKGAEEQLTTYLVHKFCTPNNLTKNFITLAAEGPIIKGLPQQATSHSVRTYTYLVIPTGTKMATISYEDRPINFSADILDEYKHFPDLVTRFENGISAWHTHKLYRLRISEIHPVARISTRIISFLRGKSYPKTGDVIRTSIIFNLDRENINGLNHVLESLAKQEVNYINVICNRNDPVYNALYRYSIYSYDHCMVADFPIAPEDRVTVDVRCL